MGAKLYLARKAACTGPLDEGELKWEKVGTCRYMLGLHGVAVQANHLLKVSDLSYTWVGVGFFVGCALLLFLGFGTFDSPRVPGTRGGGI